jgi:hypothetical protein
LCELGEDIDEVVVEIRELEHKLHQFLHSSTEDQFTLNLTDRNTDNLLVIVFCLECNGSMSHYETQP